MKKIPTSFQIHGLPSSIFSKNTYDVDKVLHAFMESNETVVEFEWDKLYYSTARAGAVALRRGVTRNKMLNMITITQCNNKVYIYRRMI